MESRIKNIFELIYQINNKNGEYHALGILFNKDIRVSIFLPDSDDPIAIHGELSIKLLDDILFQLRRVCNVF